MRIEEYLQYEPETGKIFWRATLGRAIKVGDEAGGIHKGKYRYIKFNGKSYSAHHLAWRLHYGVFPLASKHIDHINGNCSDNSIKNLRLATRSENLFNSKLNKRNKFGLKGVSACGKKFRAQIRKDNKRICLGIYATPLEAAEAYRTAAKRLAKEFARW